ncbi:protein Lin1p [[Candida] jaroonii]|uniref:Protein Lin1p n=1 Tax=[Candida] jaroonii TaxID=467808 RepID=A0ACA9Y2G4_9ASCO|nr:protein Lin1p [[Candida] jaroonii]
MDDDFVQDIPGNDKKRRKEVINEYSSESESEEEKEVKVEVEEEEKDDDSDMFASDEEPDKPAPTEDKKKKKNNRLDMNEFEKEMDIESKYVDQEVEVYDNYDEVQDYYNNVEDFDGQQRTKFEPKIDSFDLRKEEDEGFFDEDGNFVRNKEEERDEAWLNDVSREQIQKAKAAELERQRKIQTLENKPTETMTELLFKLISILDPDETPMEALTRFAPKRKGKKKVVDLQDKDRKIKVIMITDVCDKLMNQKGISDVYELVREELMRFYRTETGEDFKAIRGTKRQLEDAEIEESEIPESEIPESEIPESEQPESEEKIYEFKWEGQDEINGPYSEYEIRYWKDNYFEDNAYVRKINEEFIHISEF